MPDQLDVKALVAIDIARDRYRQVNPKFNSDVLHESLGNLLETYDAALARIKELERQISQMAQGR